MLMLRTAPCATPQTADPKNPAKRTEDRDAVTFSGPVDRCLGIMPLTTPALHAGTAKVVLHR
jgi:hypothetical protein